MLLEDLAPAEQGDQLAGCTRDVARAALRELVGLQAPAWCDASLHELKWLRDAEVAAADTMPLYRQTLPGFVERYGPSLAADEVAIIQRVGEASDTPFHAEFPEVFSLVHVDYRLDNLMINTTGSGIGITAVDWQSITLGAPMNDVAYFIGAGLEPQVRKPVEEELVRGYHEDLLRAGVPDYSWDDCWLGYRRGAFAALLSPSSRPCWFNAPIVAIPCLPPWHAATRGTPLISGRENFCVNGDGRFSECLPRPCVPLDPDPLPVCFHRRISSLPGSSDRI